MLVWFTGIVANIGQTRFEKSAIFCRKRNGEHASVDTYEQIIQKKGQKNATGIQKMAYRLMLKKNYC